MKSKIYAIDFDGFLCKDKYPEIGEPKHDNITYVKDLKNDGHIIILWTCREGELLDEAIDWCKQNGIIFDYINENTSENIKKYGGNSRKIFADYYLDDRSIYIYDDYTENKKGEIMKDNENLDPIPINEVIKENDSEPTICIYSDMCKNFDNDILKNKNRKKEDGLFCKKCDPYENSGRIECKNLDPISINEVSNSFSEFNKQYNIVNNPAHYIKDRLFEPAFVINDWGVNWYVGTCIKYLSRLGRKDASDQDILKALWYIIVEIAMNHKDISKEQVLDTIKTIYERKEKYGKIKKE